MTKSHCASAIVAVVAVLAFLQEPAAQSGSRSRIERKRRMTHKEFQRMFWKYLTDTPSAYRN